MISYFFPSLYIFAHTQTRIVSVLVYVHSHSRCKPYSIFLNFAALQFLQSIDDVAFTLADEGFFGDRMEKNCGIVRRVKFPRLQGSELVASLDSILYGLTCMALFGIYAFVLVVADDRRAQLVV